MRTAACKNDYRVTHNIVPKRWCLNRDNLSCNCWIFILIITFSTLSAYYWSILTLFLRFLMHVTRNRSVGRIKRLLLQASNENHVTVTRGTKNKTSWPNRSEQALSYNELTELLSRILYSVQLSSRYLIPWFYRARVFIITFIFFNFWTLWLANSNRIITSQIISLDML